MVQSPTDHEIAWEYQIGNKKILLNVPDKQRFGKLQSNFAALKILVTWYSSYTSQPLPPHRRSLAVPDFQDETQFLGFLKSEIIFNLVLMDFSISCPKIFSLYFGEILNTYYIILQLLLSKTFNSNVISLISKLRFNFFLNIF